MSVAQIFQALQAAAQSGALSGNAPPGLGDLLQSLGTTTLNVTGGAAHQDADSAWLTGTTQFRSTTWSLTLTGRVAGNSGGQDLNALTLQLVAQPATGWTFGQAFSSALPGTRRVAATDMGGLVLGPSVIAPLVLNQPQIAAANIPAGGFQLARLQGWLVLAGTDLSPYGTLLGDRLWLDGTMNFTQPAQPILHLPAASPGVTFNIGAIRLDAIGIKLVNDYPDPSPFPQRNAPTSAALIYGHITLPAGSTDSFEISAPLLTGDYVWPLSVDFSSPLTLSNGVSLLMYLMGGSAGQFSLPPGIAALDKFGISQLEFGIVPPVGPGANHPRALALPDVGLAYSSVTIRSTSGWNPPIPFIVIDEVGVRWVFCWNDDGVVVVASVFGSMTFGKKKARAISAPQDDVTPDDDVTLKVWLDLPQLTFSATTTGEIDLPIDKALSAYFDGAPPAGLPTLSVSSIDIEASLLMQTYQGNLVVKGNWRVTAGRVTFNLEEIELWIAVSQSSVSGMIAGTIRLTVPGATDVLMRASADYTSGPNAHWVFECSLAAGPLKLLQFVAGFLGAPYPRWMDQGDFDIALERFDASYSTAPGNPYRVRGTLSAAIRDTVIGIPMSLTASAEIAYQPAANAAAIVLATPLASPLPTPLTDPPMVLSGSLSGTFTVVRFTVAAGVSFIGEEKTYTFSVRYKDLTLVAATSYIGNAAARHQIVTVHLEGVTLGEVVTYFVNLANPNANYRLSPPWDFLNSIDLSRFSLVIDPTLQTISFTYQVDLDLVFVSVATVGLLFDRSSGETSVKFVLTGRFLGQDRTGDNAIVWDAAKDAPPEVPGKGSELLSLRYLGLGQHVTPAGLTTFTSVSDVLAALRASLVPMPASVNKVTIDPAKLAFDEASQWLVGLDATFMDTVTIKLILHDPDLYGVLLALDGPEAKSLAGFSFELLYKKVTQDVGVFHARLQVPDAFRQLQFGVASVTLGVISVDIYTNGNFRVDLGFPRGRDFTDSFAVEVEIFNGRGGIYFGLLDGATSMRVPRVTNGQFSPVIELGIGLMVGVGRTFTKGPLSAGLYVDLIAILEGTLAWFHPTDTGAPTAMYFWCRGTAGIVGKLYGSVDFKIISVDISVEAYATVTLTYEVYRPMLVELEAGVSVYAKVKVLFVTIWFSYALTIKASFVIGHESTPPWTLAAGETSRTQAQLAGTAHAPRRRRPADVATVTRHAYHQARALGGSPTPVGSRVAAVAAAPYHLVFDKSAKVFPDAAVHDVTLKLVPAFTIANVPVAWQGTTPPPNPNPDYRVMFAIMADSAVPPTAASIAETWRPSVDLNAHAATAGDTTFNQLAEALLRWSLNAMGVTSPTATVTLGQLEELVDQLAYPQAADDGFSWTNLDGFLTNNLNFLLSAPTSSGDITGVPFPMIPVLQWTTADLPPPYTSMNFWSYQPVDATYAAEALAYFASLDPRSHNDQTDPLERLAAVDTDVVESMASFVFRDYFLLVARTAVQAAVDLMTAFPHVVATPDSLQSIAASFPTAQAPYIKIPDDSVEHVAYVFGMSSGELLALNAGFAVTLANAAVGATLQVTLGVTPESLAGANPNWAIAPNVLIHLQTLVAPVQNGDTLTTIARRYGSSASALFTSVLSDRVLAGGASLPLPAFTYANPNGLSIAEVAAVYYVRLPKRAAGEEIPFVDWYTEAIAGLNSTTLTFDAPLPNPLFVPTALNVTTGPRSWVPLPDDTLDRVASYLALSQNVVTGTPFATWLQAVQNANAPTPPTGVKLPADAAAVIGGRDSLASLAARLLMTPTDPAFQAYVIDAPILNPLASVAVPNAQQQTAANLTLVTLAQSYGLSLEDLAGRIKADPGVLAVNATKTFTVPGVPALGLEALTDALDGGKPAATIAGQVSRFMLHGLRLNAPVLDGGVYHATGPMTGVYELIGQLVPGPAPPPPPPPPVDPSTVRVTLTITASQTVAWLTFATSITTGEGETLAALEQRHPSLHALNPAVRTRAAANAAGQQPTLPSGMVVLVSPTDTLTVTITNGQLTGGYPDTGLLAVAQGGLNAMTLARQVAVRHAITHPIRWQTTVAPKIPIVGTPSAAPVDPTLWLLPGDLMATAASGASSSAYQLDQVTPQAGPNTTPAELSAYAWGMLVDINVHRIPGSAGTVEVLGADTADRQRLALVLQYLGILPSAGGPRDFPPPPTGEAVTWQLLWQLPPSAGAAAGAPSGLTTTALSPSASFLVKVNLSTETHSGQPSLRGVAGPTSGPYFASCSNADAPRFLTLVWECSVVGGGGYWLHCEAPDGTRGIPDSIFDQDGRATLTLLVQLASQSTVQSTTSWPVRTLFAFNNCVVVGDGIDPGSVALFAQSPAVSTTEATVTPGNVGFTLDLTNPTSSSSPITPQQALQELYSLIGYQLLATTAFNASPEGQPVGPSIAANASGPGNENVWHLARVVPIYRFARVPSLPALSGLPLPADDPYAGINGNGGAMASATVQLWFHDVLGNASAGVPSATADVTAQVPVPVGYTDPLIGVGAWPSTAVDYFVTTPGAIGDPPTADPPTTAQLGVRLSLQSIAYQPGGAQSGGAAALKAARDLVRFGAVYCQIMQPDVQAHLLTSLQQAPAATDPDSLPTSLATLRGFVMGCYALLSSLAQCGPFHIAGTPQPTLGDVVTQYGVDYDAIGAANADQALSALLSSTTLAVPQIVTFKAGDSVSAICQAQPAPKPDPTVVLADVDNVVLPLQAGVELVVPTHTVTVPAAVPPAAAPSVNDLLALCRCSLTSLVAANAGTASLLSPGFVFDCNGYTVTVGTTPTPPGSDMTLNDVAAAFAQQGLPYDATAVVRFNAAAPGMFRPGATLQVTGYVAVPGDTLAANKGQLTPTQLAPLNGATVDIFPVGTPLFLQAPSQTLSATSTLADTATLLNITPGDLLRHNPGVVLAGQQFAVPGLSQWPADAGAVRVPYRIKPNDTLEIIAAAFLLSGPPASAALALAQMNADMPGTMAAGQTITVGSQHATTQAGDSFDIVCNQRFSPPVTLDALVAAIASTPGMLAPGALLICPPGVLPAAVSPAVALTPVQAAVPYGISPADLLSANAGTPGVIYAGVTLQASAIAPDATEITTAHDSMTAIVRRFQRRGVQTSVEALVAANLQVAFVTAAAHVVLPPADAIATATLGGLTTSIDAPWEFPAPVFPVHVWIELSRNYALCNADLRGTAASPTGVVRDRTAASAARQGLPADRTDGGALTLTGFATALESAIPVIRVATGKVLSEQEDASATDVWAVVFSSARIASVSVVPPLTLPGVTGPQPRSFALRPLANSLVARQDVQIQQLDPSTGLLTGGQAVSYQGVDLEVFARSFLADMDLVLSSRYAPGAYAVNSSALQSILDTKKALAAAVAAGLDTVLQGENVPAGKRDAAREALRQELLLSLSAGYGTSAVLQYDSTVASPWTTEEARFSGAASVTFDSSDPQLQTASVSNAKISLANGPSQISLLVSVPDVEAHETLPMTLTWRVVELEFNVATEIEGYDRSDWLTFVNPVLSGSPAGVSIDLGAPQVPLPLRAYPPVPALLDQTAVPPGSVTVLDDAVHWSYRFTLRHQSAAQDEILLEVQLNHSSNMTMAKQQVDDDLFARLAQYTAVSAPLVGILSALDDWKTANQTLVSAALSTFNQLASQVATAWDQHWDISGSSLTAGWEADTPPPTGPAAELYAFTMTLQADNGGAYYQTLMLERTAKGGTVGWPSIACYTADGTRHDLTPGTDCHCPPSSDCQCYDFGPGANVPAFQLLTFELTFPSLHIASYQNAMARVWVTRNAELFGGPQPATADAFVYQTPKISYAEAVIPLISVADRLALGTWSYTPAQCPLQAAFATIFDNDTTARTISCGVRYGYQLAAGPPPLESYLPVKQSASVPYDPAATVGDIANALQLWFNSQQPSVTGGCWSFWIEMYSTVDAGLKRPVLQLKRLVSMLA